MSLTAKRHRLTTIDISICLLVVCQIHVQKPYRWRRLLSIILYRVALFSFVYHGLGVSCHFYFSLFFFSHLFPVYPFVASQLLRARVYI